MTMNNDMLMTHCCNCGHLVSKSASGTKSIMVCAKCGAEIEVIVRKDGKELTFKTETGDLRRDCTGGYSHWHMIAADRRRFFECFGRNAEYKPEEILRITYGRSILYEANG